MEKTPMLGTGPRLNENPKCFDTPNARLGAQFDAVELAVLDGDGGLGITLEYLDKCKSLMPAPRDDIHPPWRAMCCPPRDRSFPACPVPRQPTGRPSRESVNPS